MIEKQLVREVQTAHTYTTGLSVWVLTSLCMPYGLWLRVAIERARPSSWAIMV